MQAIVAFSDADRTIMTFVGEFVTADIDENGTLQVFEHNTGSSKKIVIIVPKGEYQYVRFDRN